MVTKLNELIIRPELKGDFEAVSKIHLSAFNQSFEAELVDNLRRHSLFAKSISLVALFKNLPVGHLLLFPVFIKGDRTVFATLSLAPMAVLPDFQRLGIGSKLVETALDEAKTSQFGSVIVLGHPGFYPRFGFKPASQFYIKSPFDVPDEAFMVAELEAGSLKGIAGTVEYPASFFSA